MKKRILLALLPAAMALAACSGIQSSPKQANLMLEDTVAHEEVFGAADEIGDLRVTRMNPRRIEFAADFIKMGYQIQFDAGGEGTADDKINIRFIAAIKDSNVQAYWHRGLAQPNGFEGTNLGTELAPNWKFKLSDGVVNESLKIYSSLNDGGNTITAGAGDYVGYEGFIIYTLMNIPYETYKDSYLGAFVEVVDPDNGSNTQKSKFLAIKVEKETSYTSKNAFAVEDASIYGGKHFLQGRINGSDQTVLEDETVLESSNNYASYKDLSLLADDYFGSYYFRFGSLPDEQHFQFFGHDSFFAESVDLFDESDVLAEYVSPKAAGTHTLFVSKGGGTENHVYSAKDGASHAFTVTVQDWTGNDDVALFASVQHSNHVWYWVSASLTNSTTLTFNAPDNISCFLLVRCHNGTTVPNWDETGNVVGRIYNKTADTNTDGGYSYSTTWVDYPN